MSELTEQLRHNFADEEYRNAYADSFQNSYVAAQIKVLREEYPMTQEELAEEIGSQQPGVARLENVNYSSWKVGTLRKIARALKVRLKITFEEWGTLPEDIEHFNRESLKRRPFEKDPIFSPEVETPRNVIPFTPRQDAAGAEEMANNLFDEAEPVPMKAEAEAGREIRNRAGRR